MATSPAKWCGGKRKLVPELMKAIGNESFRNYHEPFLGGGALFFALQEAGRISKAYLSDLNMPLIETFTAIRDHHVLFLRKMAEQQASYLADPKGHYARERDAMNKVLTDVHPHTARAAETTSLVAFAARFLFLNKTCFNGLYRVNQKGAFNVPFSGAKNRALFDADNIRAVHEALREHACVTCVPFQRAAERVSGGDLVYFDPPYMPLSTTSNFTSYQKEGFGLKEHTELRDVAFRLAMRGARVVVSNSACPAVYDLYKNTEVFTIREVMAARAVNCDGDKRGKIAELIITCGPW